MYIDSAADAAKAVAIAVDAKTNYPAACNALETVLIHTDCAQDGDDNTAIKVCMCVYCYRDALLCMHTFRHMHCAGPYYVYRNWHFCSISVKCALAQRLLLQRYTT
jgi:hypothetical protein